MKGEREATSRTLLDRVRNRDDSIAWSRFYALYAPLLESFVRSHGLSADDAEELRDECLAVVAKKLPAFEYDRDKGGFKGWLYRLARGKVIDHLRRPKARRAETVELQFVSDPSEHVEEAWERAWREEHLRYALREAATRLSERTFQTFELLLIRGKSVPEVCSEMGMNANQVYKAKARALGCVREAVARLGTDL